MVASAMMAGIAAKTSELAHLCRRYHVRRLEIFGSATGTRFDAERSDIDLLVEFLPIDPDAYADAYFGLLEGLEELYGRHVDLAMASAAKNPYFLEAIESTRRLLYAA